MSSRSRAPAAQLQAAYQQVISAYDVHEVDFDIEGAALGNTAANALRDQALAAVQHQENGLDRSFTVPVIPSGLSSDTVAMLANAVQAGVRISAVDIMTMDYGDGAAPDPGGMMAATRSTPPPPPTPRLPACSGSVPTRRGQGSRSPR